MLLRMPVAASLNWRGQGSRRTSLMHLKRYRGGKSREFREHFIVVTSICIIYEEETSYPVIIEKLCLASNHYLRMGSIFPGLQNPRKI